jgi:RNA recognition motif-containing protein
MGKKLYVGNLPYSTNDATLAEVFAQVGKVASAKVVTDRESGRSRGFGFVEMETDAEAADAIARLHGVEYDGRAMTVTEARSQEAGGGGGRGGPRSGGRPGGGGGGRR